jgi:predicted nucleic acid-binding protein
MSVLVDTTIWSLALRRRRNRLSGSEARLVNEWQTLVVDGRVRLLGLVRQEILSGIAVAQEYERLLSALRAFEDVPIRTADYEQAAANFNTCRSRGIHGSAVDMLICAVSQRLQMPIFTTDNDFTHFTNCLPIALHRVP